MGANFDLNALSGINAASSGLAVISNNLANSQSVGFKSSRAEFADMFSGSQNSAGNGVRVEAITQDFTQGTISGTGRELDMALDGEGFFVLADQTGKYENIYTRNGSFKLNEGGLLTDQTGNEVQGYGLNPTLSTDSKPVFGTTLGSIDLDALNKIPSSTTEVTFDINVDGQEDYNTDATDATVGTAVNLAALNDPVNTATPYAGFADFTATETIHDSLGGEHRMTTDFYKRGVVLGENTVTSVNESDFDGDGTTDKYTSWIVQTTVQDYDEVTGTWLPSGQDNATPNSAILAELRFDDNGVLQQVREPGVSPIVTGAAVNADLDWVDNGTTAPSMEWKVNNPITGAVDPIAMTADYAAMTEYSGSYDIRGVTQNGYAIGDLIGLATGNDGTIEARYSNGRSVAVAQLVLANFTDKNAMEKLGGQAYAQSYNSGTAQLGTPETNGTGSVVEGSLEYSNVDTTAELVNMIQIQRTYQASAQVISTSQTLTQTILNL
jgi:flagellar hook protein FlgE